MRRGAAWGLAIVLLAMLLGGGWWLSGRGGGADDMRAGQLRPDENLHAPDLIARGRYLALAGDCAACHTDRDGVAFAGGRGIPTPFGAIPAPNLTPDDATGLGRWTFADFWRALHAGRGHDGERLYPAFPYTAYTKVTRADALALFAYLTSLPPVHRARAWTGLGFPHDRRVGLAVWQSLYFKPVAFRPDPSKSAAWNRGAYLVQGLGHCNECHASRDALGGLGRQPELAGGAMPAQDWYAPDLSTGDGGGLAGWTRQDLVDLLRTGQSARGTASGPMADVVERSTQHLQEGDLQAIATYLLALPPRQAVTAAEMKEDASDGGKGAAIYAQHCVACHGDDGRGVAGVYPSLVGNPAVLDPQGMNAVRIVLLGGFAPTTGAQPRPYSMPPFAQSLSDAQVAAVVSYIRRSWGNQAPAVPERAIGAYRQMPQR